MRVLVCGLGIAALVYAAWLALLYFQQRQMLFPGVAMTVPSVPSLPAGVERQWLATADGRIEAWLLPADADAPRPAPAVIFAHGNAEFIDGIAGQFGPLRAAGLHVLLVEYPGYGRSGGAPSQANVTAAFVAAYDWLAERQDVDAERIVGMGRSLGSGAIAALARERDLAAVVLQSAFVNVPALARDFWAPGGLVKDPFDNQAALAAYAGPILLGHGRHDRIIAYRHGQALAAATGAGLVTWNCGHNDCPPDWDAYLDSVIAFLGAHGVLRDRRSPP